MTLSASTVLSPQTSRAPTSLHFERFRPRLGALVTGIDARHPGALSLEAQFICGLGQPSGPTLRRE